MTDFADRVMVGAPAGAIPSSYITFKALSATDPKHTIDPNLPYVVLYNGDTSAHTINLTGKGPTSGTIALSLAAGAMLPLPSTTFGVLVDTNANGDVLCWSSDVGLPSLAAGSGSIKKGASTLFGTLPTTDSYVTASGSFVMLGLASNSGASPAATFTPAGSGILEVVVDLNGVAGEAGTFDEGLFQLMYGTGTPPNQGAAGTGTALTPIWLEEADIANLGPNIESVLLYAVVPLSVGTTYWFDVQLHCAATVRAGVNSATYSIKELPW